MRIILAGATGLVGAQVVGLLCQSPDVSRVVAIGRRPPALVHPKLQACTGPVEQWPSLIEGLGGDVAISTLGTTIGDAGSQQAFFAIDHDALLAFARAVCAGGVGHFLMVSSVGAHAASRNFYLATKGKAEASVDQIGFQRLDILRPGLLRGKRTGRLRVGERAAIALSPVTDMLTPAVLARYRSIAAADVAAALVQLSGASESGTFIHHNEEMIALAAASSRPKWT